MEQLTPKEWVKQQVKRAPAFAVSTTLLAGFLLASALIELSSGAASPAPPAVLVGLREEAPLKPLTPVRAILRDMDIGRPAERDRDGAVRDGGTSGDGLGIGRYEGDGTGPKLDPRFELTVDYDLSADPRNLAEPGGVMQLPVIHVTAADGPINAFLGRTGWGPGTGRGNVNGNGLPGGNETGLIPGVPPRETRTIVLSILDGLNWLKKTQETDGHWDPTAVKCGGGGAYPNAVTGLALLAFLGFGCTDKSVEYGPTVRNAVQYLLDHQATDGSFGEQMYTQGICTLALAEAYGMMPGDTRTKEAAQRGLNYILARQPESGTGGGDAAIVGGFGYTGGGCDMSVTGFQFQAIKAAETVGLDVPSAAKERAERFLELSINDDGSASYRVGNKGSVGTLSMTAANLTARLFRHHAVTAPDCARQAAWLAANYFERAMDTENYYAIYYLTLAAFNLGGDTWKKWNGDPAGPAGQKTFYGGLCGRQTKGGDFAGAWPAGDYGGTGSRVYSTAMACLTLEVYHRYQPVGR